LRLDGRFAFQLSCDDPGSVVPKLAGGFGIDIRALARGRCQVATAPCLQ
jgi:hypothetical protein